MLYKIKQITEEEFVISDRFMKDEDWEYINEGKYNFRNNDKLDLHVPVTRYEVTKLEVVNDSL